MWKEIFQIPSNMKQKIYNLLYLMLRIAAFLNARAVKS
jgi:hypothetical protein